MKVLIERIVCEVMKTTIHDVLVLMYCVIDLTYAIAIKFQKSSCHGFQQWNFKFDLVDNACEMANGFSAEKRKTRIRSIPSRNLCNSRRNHSLICFKLLVLDSANPCLSKDASVQNENEHKTFVILAFESFQME